jgi:RHS repeat-associated protein
MREIRNGLIAGLCALVLAGAASAQDIFPAAVTDQNRTGPLPFSATISGPDDSVDLSSGGLTITIPLARVKGRGMDYDLVLRYSSLVWAMNEYTLNNNNYATWGTASGNWLPTHVVGWETNQPYLTGLITKVTCLNGVQGIEPPEGHSAPGTTNTDRGSWVFTDANGAKHPIYAEFDAGGCFGEVNSGPDATSEGYWGAATTGVTVLNPDGITFQSGGTAPSTTSPAPGISLPAADGEAGMRDANGNSLTLMPGGVDTLGRTLVTETQNGSNQLIFSIYDANGNPQQITVNLTTVSTSTHFDAESEWGFNATEAQGSFPVVSSIILPNGQSYSFTYESGTYAGIASMTIPSGATINYKWATVNAGDQTHRYVASRQVTVNGVTSTYSMNMQALSWAFGSNATYQNTVTDPSGNQEIYVATGGKVSSLKEYSGAATGTPMRDTEVAYNEATQVPLDISVDPNDGALPVSITTTLNSSGSSITSQVQYVYDQFQYQWTWCPNPPCSDSTMYETNTLNASRGDVMEKREYDWGAVNSGQPGPLLRRTDNTFLHVANPNYVGVNIVDRLATQIVYDVSGNIVAQTDYSYDGTTPTPLSGVPQHTTPPTNYRGNPTSVKLWRNTDGAWLTTTYTYDDTGNITAITDPMTHTTQWSYTDAWGTSTGGNCDPTANSLAYPTTITDALLHQKKVIYRPCTGQEQSVRDPNDLANGRAGTQYTYDEMDRVLTITYPDGGRTTNAYNDAFPDTVTTTVAINSTVNKTTVLAKDALGRERLTTLTSDPDGATYTRISYDAMGRKYQEWNPTRCDPDTASSCSGETTFGYTTHEYDPLSREILLIPADGSATADNVQTSYFLNTVTTTDEAGVSLAVTTDAFGRIDQVKEVNTGWVTLYTHDPLGNLTCVEQHGGVSGTGCSSPPSSDSSSAWRVRRFTYDSLSHLLATKNPEAGTSTANCNGSTNPWSICYTYNNNGIVIGKTDARGYSINYNPSASPIDALNRVTEKSYSDGEPAITYAYDGGAAASNGILHRTSMVDASGSTTWTYPYDSLGSEVIESRTIAGINKTISTQNNFDGSVAAITYPSGAVVTFTPGGAGRAIGVSDTTHNIQYAQGATYAPQGALETLALGSITESNQYNTRLQPLLLSATASGQPVMSLTYNFGSGINDNGNVYQIVNGKTSTRNQTFTYDGANRIASAQTPASWGMNFVIDAWGNLTSTTPVAGTSGDPMPLSTTAFANNELAAYGYDAAGNLINDGTTSACGGNNYSWNAEEQMSCAEGVTYTYDGDGGRVEKSSGTMYWGGEAGEALAESNLSGTITSEYIFFNGKRIARRDIATGNVYYFFSDRLGSSNVVTNNAGLIQNESDFYPYGGEDPITDTLANQHYKFTGKERDSESGNDYFGARYFASSAGRWMSPDWSVQIEPIPYAKLDDPQSLNLYEYVRNNPLFTFDPDGHNWFKDFAQGVADSTYRPLVGIAKHPLAAAVGIGYAASHPFGTAKAIGGAVRDTVVAAAHGDGRAIGQIVGTGITAVATAGAAGAVAKGVSVFSAVVQGSEAGLEATTSAEMVSATMKGTGISFPVGAQPGTVVEGVDASTLQAGRASLSATRLAAQQDLLEQGTARATPIQATPEGVIWDGNHGAAAAAAAGTPVPVQVVPGPATSYGPIQSIPVVQQ